jgi:hypothetical protein
LALVTASQRTSEFVANVVVVDKVRLSLLMIIGSRTKTAAEASSTKTKNKTEKINADFNLLRDIVHPR